MSRTESLHAALQNLITAGVSDRVFEHAHATVLHRGHTVFSSGTTATSSKFDLASVTKVMSTTALLCQLGVDPLRTVGSVFPHAKVADRTVADLAFHRSGLPAFEPFFARCQSRSEVVEAALQTAPLAPNGTAATYSDIGFIILGELLSTLHHAPLDQLFEAHVAKPLGLHHSGFLPSPDQVIATGGTRPREPAPGQEGLWAHRPGPSQPGTVDDDNAFAMNGVAGHAGLFGTSADVARFGEAVLDGRIRPPAAFGWHRDPLTPQSSRAFGFDTPTPGQASCGEHFGPRAVGHLGFTGTSLWVDFDRKLVVALLTNRVIFGRANVQIRQFRPRFHDAVIAALRL